MNRKYAAWITHVAHHRILLVYGRFSGFSYEAQYAVAYASPFAPFGGFGGSAMVPGGIPRFLGSTVSFRSSRKVLAGGSQSFTLRLQAVRTPLLHFARSADDVGRIRRCQRSTCVAAAIPAPIRGRKIMPSPIRRNGVRSGRTSRHVARGRPVPPRSP